LLFNESERLSFSEIVTQLNLSEDDTARVLHTVSCGKYKILNKEPNNRTISPKDVFEFNHKFTDRMRRIKVQFNSNCIDLIALLFLQRPDIDVFCRFHSLPPTRRKRSSMMSTKTGGLQLMQH
jgi:hypothetical protein